MLRRSQQGLDYCFEDSTRFRLCLRVSYAAEEIYSTRFKPLKLFLIRIGLGHKYQPVDITTPAEACTVIQKLDLDPANV